MVRELVAEDAKKPPRFGAKFGELQRGGGRQVTSLRFRVSLGS